MQSCDVDLESETRKTKQAAPYIAVTGKPGTEAAQYFIVAECSPGTESKTMKDAVIDLIATYYVFDIAYPTGLVPLNIFFQHYVFGIKNQQPLPASTARLISNLEKL